MFGRAIHQNVVKIHLKVLCKVWLFADLVIFESLYRRIFARAVSLN